MKRLAAAVVARLLLLFAGGDDEDNEDDDACNDVVGEDEVAHKRRCLAGVGGGDDDENEASPKTVVGRAAGERFSSIAEDGERFRGIGLNAGTGLPTDGSKSTAGLLRGTAKFPSAVVARSVDPRKDGNERRPSWLPLRCNSSEGEKVAARLERRSPRKVGNERRPFDVPEIRTAGTSESLRRRLERSSLFFRWNSNSPLPPTSLAMVASSRCPLVDGTTASASAVASQLLPWSIDRRS